MEDEKIKQIEDLKESILGLTLRDLNNPLLVEKVYELDKVISDFRSLTKNFRPIPFSEATEKIIKKRWQGTQA